MQRRFRRFHADETGAVAFFVALLVPVIFGMGAMVLDLSRGWENRRQLQNCADAAALAGARDLPVAALAEVTARTYLANCLDVAEVLTAGVDAAIDRNGDGLPDTVEVIDYRTVTFSFARLLGIEEGTVATRALAGKVQPVDLYRLEPFGVQVDPGVPCGGRMGDYSINTVPIVPGAVYIIKYGAVGNNVPGNFQPLALGGPGSNIYRDNVENGYDGWVATCGTVTTQTGNVVGPTIQGLDRRLVPPVCDETAPRWSECPWVIQVAFIPPLQPGNQDTQVLTFAYFIVMSYERIGNQAATITGRFLDTTNRYIPGGAFRGDAPCDPLMGLPCGLKLLE